MRRMTKKYFRGYVLVTLLRITYIYLYVLNEHCDTFTEPEVQHLSALIFTYIYLYESIEIWLF